MSHLPLSESHAESHSEFHYVYLARCANGAIYTGYSKNVAQRIATHNAGKGGHYTRAHRPVELLACWSCRTKTAALKAEYAIKQLPRPQKLALATGDHAPEWLNNFSRE
jgi:putative endonuclease